MDPHITKPQAQPCTVFEAHPGLAAVSAALPVTEALGHNRDIHSFLPHGVVYLAEDCRKRCPID